MAPMPVASWASSCWMVAISSAVSGMAADASDEGACTCIGLGGTAAAGGVYGNRLMSLTTSGWNIPHSQLTSLSECTTPPAHVRGHTHRRTTAAL